MICLDCHHDNPASARFCRHCGAAVGRACLTCGFENPSPANFCGGCGARLAEAQAEDTKGERRQVTVLFCDLVGSTPLSQMLDPEELSRLLAEYQRICGEAVAAHDGYIAQYLGDGVVVYFGYPRSYEDEPHRAVRCGLDIVAGMSALQRSGMFPPEIEIAVRVGAHTGRVVVGPVGAGDRRERLALGSTPNIAARIQGEAEPGTVVISAETWKIVQGYFHAESLGPRELKGVPGTQALYRVTGVGESSERVEVAGLLTPYVGRSRERAVLDELWKESAPGASRFALLRGEPGVGKSRLAQRFRDDVAGSTAHVLQMRTSPYRTSSPFHPVIELIERRLGLDADLSPEQRRERFAETLVRLGLPGPEPLELLGSLLSLSIDTALDLPPARRRHRTLELLVELLAAVAASGPTLLVVEDLHWADSSTVEFLELLVYAAPAVSLLGLITTRPEGSFAASGPQLRVVEVPRLGRADVETMVRAVALGKALPQELVGHIVARSDGVPLFVEELTRSVLESGMLREQDLTWEAVDVLSESMIPASVDASLMARIDRLGASQATAQLAATIGREFDAALLTEVSERDPATVARDLDQLVQAGLAWPVEGESDRYEFSHALVRDAAYNSLLRTTRQVHHRRIADALRTAGAGQPDLIARHLSAAGAAEDAIEFWEAAADLALSRTSSHAAADHLRAAVQCLNRLPASPANAEREMELQVRSAPLLMAVHGWAAQEVEQACERALSLARSIDRPDDCFLPLYGLWTVSFLRGELSRATERAEEVLAMARQFEVPMLELSGLHALSYTLCCRGDYERAVAEADAGLELFDLDNEQLLAGMFGLAPTVALRGSRACSLWMLGRLAEAEEELAQMLALGRKLEHPPSLAAALGFALYAEACECSHTGVTERMAQLAGELAGLAADDDFFLWHALATTCGAIVALDRGQAPDVGSLLAGLELWERAGARLTLVMINVFCAEALLRAGHADEAHRRLDAAEAEAARGEGPMAPEIDRIRGRLLARAGDAAGAETRYRAAIDRARGQHAPLLEQRAADDLSRLLAEPASHP